MSILSNIFDRLVHHGKAEATTSAQAAPSQPSQNTTASAPQPTAAAPAAQAAPQATQAAPAALKDVDMEQVLEGLAAKNTQTLNWRTSIVDLMKLLGMDSSLDQRKQLADELGYRGDKNDSAAMNIWLHEQVIRKVAENGGKVPAGMMH